MHVVDVVNGRVLQNRDVFIKGKRIELIAEHGDELLQASQHIDGEGYFLLPGLWDMHVHFRINQFQNGRNPPETLEENKDLLPLFVAHGITSVHDMGGDITDHLVKWRAEIESGDLLGPSLYLVGPKFEGASPHYGGSYSITNRQEADHALHELREWRVDGVKLMGGGIDPDLFNYVLERSQRFSLRSYAHLLESSPAVEASEHSLDALAHMRGVVAESSPGHSAIIKEMWDRGIVTPLHDGYSEYLERMYSSVDIPILKENVNTLSSNGTWLISTYNRRKVRSRYDLIPDQVLRDLDYVGTNIGDGIRRRHERIMQQPPSDLLRISHEYNVRLVQLLPESDVGFLIGTDAGTGNLAPGRSYHLEMASLVEDGLEPAYVLRAATISAARFMGKEATEGSVSEGKKADLVMLESNPLEHIESTEKIVGVMRDGQWLSRSDLDRLLDELKAKYARQ